MDERLHPGHQAALDELDALAEWLTSRGFKVPRSQSVAYAVGQALGLAQQTTMLIVAGAGGAVFVSDDLELEGAPERMYRYRNADNNATIFTTTAFDATTPTAQCPVCDKPTITTLPICVHCGADHQVAAELAEEARDDHD